MDRYWNDPEATAATLRDGWLLTGDLGRLDEAGCLTLAGRKKEMYIRGGYNVYPVEVEAVLGDHPGVDQVAVVPRPDPVMGEVGVAAVVLAPGAGPRTWSPCGPSPSIVSRATSSPRSWSWWTRCPSHPDRSSIAGPWPSGWAEAGRARARAGASGTVRTLHEG